MNSLLEKRIKNIIRDKIQEYKPLPDKPSPHRYETINSPQYTSYNRDIRPLEKKDFQDFVSAFQDSYIYEISSREDPLELISSEMFQIWQGLKDEEKRNQFLKRLEEVSFFTWKRE